MNKLLIICIVSALCFVGTASEVGSLIDITTVDGSVFTTTTDNNLLWLTAEGECQHDKLKALGNECWGYISKLEYCPTEYRLRAYKCKECKQTIVVQQAILIESKGETK